MDPSPVPHDPANPPTELEVMIGRLAYLNPGKTKRGKPRKKANIAELARELMMDEQTCRDALKRFESRQARQLLAA